MKLDFLKRRPKFQLLHIPHAKIFSKKDVPSTELTGWTRDGNGLMKNRITLIKHHFMSSLSSCRFFFLVSITREINKIQFTDFHLIHFRNSLFNRIIFRWNRNKIVHLEESTKTTIKYSITAMHRRRNKRSGKMFKNHRTIPDPNPNSFRIIEFMNCTQEIQRIREKKKYKMEWRKEFRRSSGIDSLAEKLLKWKMMLRRAVLFFACSRCSVEFN